MSGTDGQADQRTEAVTPGIWYNHLFSFSLNKTEVRLDFTIPALEASDLTLGPNTHYLHFYYYYCWSYEPHPLCYLITRWGFVPNLITQLSITKTEVWISLQSHTAQLPQNTWLLHTPTQIPTPPTPTEPELIPFWNAVFCSKLYNLFSRESYIHVPVTDSSKL